MYKNLIIDKDNLKICLERAHKCESCQCVWQTCCFGMSHFRAPWFKSYITSISLYHGDLQISNKGLDHAGLGLPHGQIQVLPASACLGWLTRIPVLFKMISIYPLWKIFKKVVYRGSVIFKWINILSNAYSNSIHTPRGALTCQRYTDMCCFDIPPFQAPPPLQRPTLLLLVLVHMPSVFCLSENSAFLGPFVSDFGKISTSNTLILAKICSQDPTFLRKKSVL